MNTLFVLTLLALLGVLFYWSFNHLQKERWQFIGAMPATKRSDGSWEATSLTFYGLFNAVAYVLASGLFIVLTGAAGAQLTATLLAVLLLLGLCVPASKWIAYWVEGKPHTFSVGGAFFVGVVAGPWLLLGLRHILVRYLGLDLPVMATLSAIAIAYAFGEGIGRLACISFGCCYGKPLSSLPPWLSGLLFRKRIMFTFRGKTKKIAYAHGLDRHPTFPVQGITAVIYCFTGLAATYLFLLDRMLSAFVMTIMITQLWRFGSEFLRADYRGHGRISAYQIMALIGCVYALSLSLVFNWLQPAAAIQPDIRMGLHYLWNPLVLLILQGLGAGIFLFTGRSQVTGAVIRFHVRSKRV